MVSWSLTWKICRYFRQLPNIHTTSDRDKTILISNHKLVQQGRFMLPIFIFQQQHYSVQLILSALMYNIFPELSNWGKWILPKSLLEIDLTWENVIYKNWHFFEILEFMITSTNIIQLDHIISINVILSCFRNSVSLGSHIWTYVCAFACVYASYRYFSYVNDLRVGVHLGVWG